MKVREIEGRARCPQLHVSFELLWGETGRIETEEVEERYDEIDEI